MADTRYGSRMVDWPEETPKAIKGWLAGYTAIAQVVATTGGKGKPHRSLTVRTTLTSPPVVGFEVTIGIGHEIFTDMDKALEAYCDGI